MSEYRLSMQERLNCSRSYADDDTKDLMCEMGCNCNGTLYECCLWENEGLEDKVLAFLESEGT